MLVAGGGTGDVYSPASGTWTATGADGLPYASAAGALLPTGNVLYVAGIRSGSEKFGGCEPLPDAALFTP